MLKTENYFVAYIDILGIKKMIENDDKDYYLNKIYNCMNAAIEQAKIMMNVPGCDNIKIKIFSDNMIFAIPSDFHMTDDHHPVISLNRIGTIVGSLQRMFLEAGFLTRGGVTHDKLYIDDTLVWGKALLDSYNLENNIAGYPRVVIDLKVKKIANLLVLDDESRDVLEMNNMKMDFDGIYFFDYLNFPDDKGIRTIVTEALVDIDKKIKEENNLRVIQIYEWHKNYLLSCQKQWP
ncbi:hypothetical protein LJC56_02670 [Christensenellaceae bacterium OttesenSCG-928-K19]|nr:hypothetical protein [Christensenellaceae bacterium OttesenSCG-928-K19]